MPAELYLVEVIARDWPAAVAWYEDVLGLERLLEDDEHQYALLSAGGAKLAIQGRPGEPRARDGVRLVFRVDDVDLARTRLLSHGVIASDPVTNEEEGYREIRLADPEGTPIRLFQWTR